MSSNRFYGWFETMHPNEYLDVETHEGVVVAVWFRCQQLPFRQAVVDRERAEAVDDAPEVALVGVEVRDL